VQALRSSPRTEKQNKEGKEKGVEEGGEGWGRHSHPGFTVPLVGPVAGA
jgi:hypothetical protein